MLMILYMKRQKEAIKSKSHTNLFPDLSQTQQNDSKMYPRLTFHHPVYI